MRLRGRGALAAWLLCALPVAFGFALPVLWLLRMLWLEAATSEFGLPLQRFLFMNRMKMSHQEVKDEYKQQEGDPHHKHKIKKLRMERAAKRMMASVPKADVIITNPTHFAVALQYEPGMAAPLCLAKGVDSLALRIREVARENQVPVVENPPLARALYATVDIDEEIPVEHYKAVAEVIGYVMRLKRRVV